MHAPSALSITPPGHHRPYTRAWVAQARPIRGGTLRWGEGRGGRIRPVRSAEVPEEASRVPGGAGAASGGEEVRSAQEHDGAGDRAESRGCRRVAENGECPGSGADSEPGFPDGTRNVQPGGERTSAPARRPGIRPARRGTECGARLCPPAGRGDRRRGGDDRHPADDHPLRPGHREPLGGGPLLAAERTDPDDARRGLHARHRRGRAAHVEHRVDRAGGRLHLRTTAPAGHAGPVRRRVERGAGGDRRADSRRRQLAVPVRA